MGGLSTFHSTTLHCYSNRYHVIYGCFSRLHNSLSPATFPPDAESIITLPPDRARDTLNSHSTQIGSSWWQNGQEEGSFLSDLHCIRESQEMLLANILVSSIVTGSQVPENS